MNARPDLDLTRTAPRPGARRLRKVMIGKRAVFTAGLQPSFWNDAYHIALTARLPAFVGGLAAAFLLVNFGFALLYAVDPQGIANSRGAFENLLYFSMETITTVGYGEFYPQTRYAHLVVGTEVFAGLFFTATMLGLIFARMSRPRARLVFARGLAVGPYEGGRTLFARVANARLNILSSATARLWVLLSETTAEGQKFRRYVELRLVRAENPAFALSWTILHPIDAASPLFGRSAEDLEREDALFLLTITGHDDTSGQTVEARESYLPDDIRWNHRFVDILSTPVAGHTVLDYARFHETEPLAAAAASRP
ncbi:ion channel [Lichenibacterium ramalinae]|uniref:Potassium transporter n=1 Tax=Lichenibacterium ramalinae TaxID=2316527 RepID=A0A4Q2REE4_9HYPH|nr:ion channel [Lichenibacterium ramalinae]RYB06290.1 potassium transporter [Lichenibacterium ramalinae]